MPSRPPQPSHSPQDRHTYIPPHVQQAMEKQMMQSMPAHMQKYVGAFMEQQVASARMGTPVTQHQQPLHSFVPHAPRQSPGDTFQRYQATPPASLPPPSPQQQPYPVSPDQPAAPPPPIAPNTAPQESYAAVPNPSAPNQPTYDFIMNPGQPIAPSAMPQLPGAGSKNGLIVRIGLIAGGLLVLLIVFVVLKSALSGGSNNKPLLIAVAQNQQAIIHLTTKADLEPSLSVHNKNFALTAQVSLTSSQSELITYLGKLGVKKIGPKVINFKVSAKSDQDLVAAAAADTYNSTFQEIMQAQLGQYQLSIKTAYAKTPGTLGRKMLASEYKQSQLLALQLADTTASP